MNGGFSLEPSVVTSLRAMAYRRFFSSQACLGTHNAGTLRGMHFQTSPFAEAKFVRCVRGAIFDVAVDLRPASKTYLQWIGETLSEENGLGLYIGPGLAHGFQTLREDTDVLYQITPAYTPGYAAGIRWDDPAFKISWPSPTPFMSERDAAYPDWTI